MNEKILDITWGTIFKILLAVVIFYFFYLLRDFLVWFVFALIISVLFDAPIEFFRKIKIPRVASVLLVYFAIFGIFGYLIYLIAPVFIVEIQHFSQNIPFYFEKLRPIPSRVGFPIVQNFEELLGSLANFLERSSVSILNAIFAIFGGIFATSFIVMIAMFLSLEERFGERSLIIFFRKKEEPYLIDLWGKIKKQISRWFLSRILASLFVGAASYLIFLIFGIDYPLSLAIFAGALNFVPIIGPLLTGAVLFIVVYSQSFALAIYIVALFTAVQQIEGSVLTPILTRKFIGLPPALVLLALAIGGKLWGVMGAILTIPLAGIIFEFARDYLKKRREEGGNDSLAR